MQQILSSPKVFGPLTKLQCCPTSDGAAAAILASERFVRSHGLEGQAVEILAMEMATDFPSTFTDRSCIKIIGYDMTKAAAEKVFRKANRQPKDIQVVELHDCFSVNELITYEALGLCAPGKGGELVDRCDNTYGGKYVVNPSGGLISKGHPLGATGMKSFKPRMPDIYSPLFSGLAQCAELCWQIRGEAGARQVQGATLGLQHNIGLGGAVVVGLYSLGFPAGSNESRRLGMRRVAAAISEDGFLATKYLRILEQAMLEDEDNLIEKYRAVYGFKVRKANGDEGFWVINAKVGKGSIEFNSKCNVLTNHLF